MTILDLLKLAAGKSADEIRDFLNMVTQRAPDLAPAAQKLLIALGTAVAPENLVALAEQLPQELINIGQGKIDPRSHPSDAA